MNSNTKNFILSATVLLFFFLSILIALSYVYRYFTINTYNYILIILMILIIWAIAFFSMALVSVLYVYGKKQSGFFFLWMARMGIKILLPFVMFISYVIKGSKEAVMNFYIEANNVMVQALNKKYLPGELLLLLPHCLQNTNCECKITNDIKKCKNCGLCCIGEIAAISRYTGISAAVVTGGTAARNIVVNYRPRLILSVACERDLISGITDVWRIPVIGIINERPNGPCCNTMVNVTKLKKALENVLRIEN